MATNDVLELVYTDYDDLKRTLNNAEMKMLNTYRRFFEYIDNMFDDVKTQIFEGEDLGSNRFIPYEAFYYNDYITKEFPEVLPYYKNKLYDFVNILRNYYMDLYIDGNFDGLDDYAVLEFTRIFDMLYNLIWGRNFEYLYTSQLEDIQSALNIDDYATAILGFKTYFDSIIEQNVKTLEKLLAAKANENEQTELFKTYLSLKKVDIETIRKILESNKTNKFRAGFLTWLDSIIDSIKHTIIYQTRAKDSVIASLQNPEKRENFRDLIMLLKI